MSNGTDDDDDWETMTCDACGHEEDFQAFARGNDDGSHSYRCPACGEPVDD